MDIKISNKVRYTYEYADYNPPILLNTIHQSKITTRYFFLFFEL